VEKDEDIAFEGLFRSSDDSPYDSLNVGFSVANIAVFLFAYGSLVLFVFNCLLEAGKRKSFRVRVQVL